MPGPGRRVKYPRGKRKIKRRPFPPRDPRHPRDGDPEPPHPGVPTPIPPTGDAAGGRTGHSSGGVTSWQDLVKKKYSS